MKITSKEPDELLADIIHYYQKNNVLTKEDMVQEFKNGPISSNTSI